MGRMRVGTCLVLTLACSGMLLPEGSLWAGELAKSQAVNDAPLVQDVALSADQSLAGMVVGVDGRPCAETSVWIETNGAVPRRAVTDSRGRFTVSKLRGGVYRIATTHGAALCRVWAAGTAPPTAHSRAILIETPEVVRGQYYGPAGQLLANPWVLAAILTSAITVVALAANRDSGS